MNAFHFRNLLLKNIVIDDENKRKKKEYRYRKSIEELLITAYLSHKLHHKMSHIIESGSFNRYLTEMTRVTSRY